MFALASSADEESVGAAVAVAGKVAVGSGGAVGTGVSVGSGVGATTSSVSPMLSTALSPRLLKANRSLSARPYATEMPQSVSPLLTTWVVWGVAVGGGDSPGRSRMRTSMPSCSTESSCMALSAKNSSSVRR